ncbi:MAG: acetylglutamate kinase [Alphaproteobacteria bacterium]|nr:acetylglutamate kinase [Alphaproteobacteria bacterium]
MSDPLSLGHIAEMMSELRAYQKRTVVVKIGGNSIAEDDLFLSKIARQVLFLNTNGVRVILIHGGGPQIDTALADKNIETEKDDAGRRITSPKAMRIVARVMKEINKQVVNSLIEAGCPKDKIFAAFRQKHPVVEADSLDPSNPKGNCSGFPSDVKTSILERALREGKIVVLHSMGIGADGKQIYNVNGDDYAAIVARHMRAKRLILVTNVSGVLDRNRERIAVIDPLTAKQLMEDGVITGGMVPKVESALVIVRQGVGGVAIIDGFRPWAILGELLTHQGRGTLFRARI